MICRDDAQWATDDRRRLYWLYLDKSFYLKGTLKTDKKKTTYPGRTCQPGNGSCGWGRFSWYGNGVVNRPSPLRWPVPAVGTYVHGATGPAAAEWACASQGQLLDLLTHHQPQVPFPLSLPVAAAGAAKEQQNSIRFRLEYMLYFRLFEQRKSNRDLEKGGKPCISWMRIISFFVTILTLLLVYMISWPLLILGIAQLSWRERGWRDAIYVMVKNVTMIEGKIIQHFDAVTWR